ncbi:thiol-disulfide oxidoreductase ResA [soil metagenome]
MKYPKFERFVTGALLSVVVGCARQETPAAEIPSRAAVTAGTMASDFTARDIDGKTVTLSEHLSKEVVLLNFCASWCEPCVAEFPHLRRIYEANRARGLFVMAISMDGPESAANVPGFARRNQLNFPMLIDDDSRISSLYNKKKAAPLTILIDKTGKIVLVREGYNAGDEVSLAREIEKALGAPPQP